MNFEEMCQKAGIKKDALCDTIFTRRFKETNKEVKNNMRCVRCDRELEYARDKGWYHKELNSIYIMKCKDCGFIGGTAIICPKCGSKNYIDDHCALPDLSNPNDFKRRTR